MKFLIKKLIEEKEITIFLTVVIAIIGCISYYILPKQENPNVSVPIALITSIYPGASASDVDELVSKKIEDELTEIDGYKESKTISKEGVSIVQIELENDVNVTEAMQEVRNKVSDIESELPNGASIYSIKTDFTETAGIVISLSGSNYTYEQLASFGDQFKDKLLEIDGVSKFNVEGEIDKEVKVDIDIKKLNELNISLSDIYSLLQIQNIEIPSGNLDTEEGKVQVKTPGMFSSIEDIKNTIIGVSPENGNVLRLSDIAHVYMDVEEGVPKFKRNGKNAVLLTGYFKKGENVVIIGKDVRKVIDDVKGKLPEDLIVEEVVYQPQDVSNSTDDFMRNLIEGMILVVVVVLLGMGMRNAIVVSTAIPISILMTFIAMYLVKIDIHQMSLTALIIALGILVDNAIVISDAIQVKLNNGIEKVTACYEATKESSIPIFTATLTTIAAFAPLLGIPGAAGEFLGAVPRVLIISIISAYVVAMFIIPAMGRQFFEANFQKTEKKSFIRLFFEHLLERGLKHKKFTIGFMIGLLIITIQVIMPMLPQTFFPYADKDLFYLDIYSEIPGNIEETEELVDKVSELLVNEPEIISTTAAVGTGLPKFYMTLPVPIPTVDYGQLVCKYDLGEGENRRFENKEEMMAYIQKLCNENIPSGRVTVNLLANAKPEPKILFRLSNDNIELLREAKNTVKKELSQMEGITNLKDDLDDDTFQLQINVDDEKAANYGITKYDIQRQVNMALFGVVPSVYRKSGNEYNILLKSDIKDMDLLENLYIKSSITEDKIPLKQFAQISYSSKNDSVNRYKRKKAVEITADPLPGYNASELETKIETEILPKLDLDGININFNGERELIKENFSVLGLLAILAVFVIYIILIFQFNSFVQPLVILTTIPLSLIGSVFGLFLFKQPFSLTALLGIIALIGLVVKNGILLVEYINDAKKVGYGIEEACVDAVDKRFNPIMLGATTTILGLFPLAISGSSLFAPMAVALMSGLIAATFLTLVIVPVLYTIAENMKIKVATNLEINIKK